MNEGNLGIRVLPLRYEKQEAEKCTSEKNESNF